MLKQNVMEPLLDLTSSTFLISLFFINRINHEKEDCEHSTVQDLDEHRLTAANHPGNYPSVDTAGFVFKSQMKLGCFITPLSTGATCRGLSLT